MPGGEITGIAVAVEGGSEQGLVIKSELCADEFAFIGGNNFSSIGRTEVDMVGMTSKANKASEVPFIRGVQMGL